MSIITKPKSIGAFRNPSVRANLYPGLLTVRAVECLRSADVVLYDYLVDPRTLSHAPRRAELIAVGKRGWHGAVSQESINDLMIATGIDILEPGFEFEEGDGAEVQGIVTTIVSADEIVLNDTQRVLITSDTRFERGTREDVVLNARVEADGFLQADGALLAEEIEIVSTP